MFKLSHIVIGLVVFLSPLEADIPCRVILWNGMSGILQPHQPTGYYEAVKGIRLLSNIPVHLILQKTRMRPEVLNRELGWEEGKEKVLLVLKETEREDYLRYRSSQWVGFKYANFVGSAIYYGVAWPFRHSFHWHPVRIDKDGKWTSLDIVRGEWVEATTPINHDAIYLPLKFGTPAEQEQALSRLREAKGKKAYTLSCAQGACKVLAGQYSDKADSDKIGIRGYPNFFEILADERPYQVEKVIIHGTRVFDQPHRLPESLRWVDRGQTQLFVRIGLWVAGSATGGGYLLFSIFDDD